MDLAKLFGWVVETREDVSIEERLSRMTDEQRMEEARQLAERMRQRLIADGFRTIDGKVIDVTPREPEDR
jgi:predicted ATPase